MKLERLDGLIDIGANLTHDSFDDDRERVIAEARAAGLTGIVLTSTSVSESRSAIELATTDPEFFRATAGVHPHHATEFDDEAERRLEQLHADSVTCAVGECGLDFFRDFSPRDDQERAFEAQLDLAARLDRPVFLHQRDAHERFVAILREYRDRLPAAVVHCFTGTDAELADYRDLDCHIGITGWICDERRGLHLRELVPEIPADRLMVETDAPFLIPRDLRPKPKTRRNEPKWLPHIVATIAESRGESPEDTAAGTARTTRAFFGTGAPPFDQ